MSAAPARVLASSGRRRLVNIHEARTNGILLEQGVQDLRSAGVYKVILLREGPGNPRDRHYYSADAIRNAPPIFNGKPAFVDHPDMIEEEVQPERSVKDVVGWYENVAAVKEAGSGKWLLTSELWTIPGQSVQWCRDLLDAALLKRERDPVSDDLIGLSINATGITVPKDVGSEQWHEVQEFVEAKSTDLVTQAGAGGRVVALKEAMRKRILSRVQEGLMSAVQVKGAIDTLRDRFNVAGDPVLRSVLDELGKVYADLTHEEAERSDTSMGRAAEVERRRAGEDERGGRAAEDERGGRASEDEWGGRAAEGERGMSAEALERRVRGVEREMERMRGGRAAEDERGRAAEDERGGRAGERGRASEDERGRAAERGRASEDERGGRAAERRGRASEDERGGRAAEAYMGEEEDAAAPAGPTAGPSFADWARSEMGELPAKDKGDDDDNGGGKDGKGAEDEDEAEDGHLGLDDHIKGMSARLKAIEDEIDGARAAGGKAFKVAEREAEMGERRRESSAPSAQPSGAGRGNYGYSNVAPYDFGNVTRAAEAEDEDERARAEEARAAEAKGGEDEEEDEEEGERGGRASERGRRRASEDAISHSRLPGVTEEARAAEARRRAAEDEDLPPHLHPKQREARALRREVVRLKALREERARRRALSIPSTLREAAARENYHMLAAARPSYQDLVVELAKARTSLQAYKERDENAEILREVDAPESSWKFLTHQMTGLPYKEKRALAESYCAPLRVREYAVERFGQGPGGSGARVGRVDGAELAAFMVGQGVPMEGRH